MSKFIFVLFLLSSSAFADEWTTADTYRESAFQILNVIDWGQTQTIAANPDKFIELNPILGKHPDSASVNTYFAFTAIVHYGIAHILESDWRILFQNVTFGMESKSVLNNFSLGIMIEF